MVFAMGVSDIGGVDILKRVSLQSKLNNVVNIFYSDSRGAVNGHTLLSGEEVIFSSKKTLRNFFEERHPSIAVATPNLHQELIPIEFINIAHEEKIPSVLIQDFWGNHNRGRWIALPDMICVQDDLGKKLVLETWPNIPEDKVIITGQPAFDDLVSVDQVSANKELRRKFQLSQNWPIVHFSGGTYGMSEALIATIRALNMLRQPVYLFFCHHPNLFINDISNDFKKIYNECINILKELVFGEVVLSDFSTPSDLINAAADIVVSMYSVMLVKACYLRKNCISILVSESQQNLEKATGGLLKEFPPVVLGACLSGITDTEIAACLNKIFSNNVENIRIAQAKNFTTDGKSTQRVLSTILNFLKNK